jgi:hypothetical protein
MNELAISIAVNILLGLILFVVLYWKRGADTARLAGADEAMRNFVQHCHDTVAQTTVADDQRGALFDLQQGGIGLLQRHGRRWNARTLSSGEVSRVELDGETIKLKFADFGWPRAQIRIADSAARELWLDRLRSLQELRHA